MKQLLCPLLMMLLLTGCAGRSDSQPRSNGKPIVAVVNYPLKYFAERIGGELIEVRFPIPADEDPDFWKPDEKLIEAYQQADLILLNGAGYGRWLASATLPPAKCVDTSTAFKGKLIQLKESITHSHGPAGEHTHTGTASLTWLDFHQALEQARSVRDALLTRLPEQRSTIEQRFAELEKDLLALDREMQNVISANRTQPLIASHPVFQYWARRYELKLESVHFEADEMPDEQSFAELSKLQKIHPARWIIWEDTPKPEIVTKLKSMGLNSAVFLTTGNTPETGDFLTQMKQNIDNLRLVFQP